LDALRTVIIQAKVVLLLEMLAATASARIVQIGLTTLVMDVIGTKRMRYLDALHGIRSKVLMAILLASPVVIVGSFLMG
jgi:putative Mn2+ efflux pump MntP